MDRLTAEDVIARLGLEPHPEGGAFRETFRDPQGPDGRGHATAIYYLLRGGEVSRWHRVDAAEIWHHYAGAPLELAISPDGEAVTRQALGPDILAGQVPQGVVPTAAWQSARSLGDPDRGQWTLVGCTVAPGFTFDGFELAPDGWTPGAGED